MHRMSSADRWHHKCTAAQPITPPPENLAPSQKELRAAGAAATSFNVVLQHGVRNNCIYIHRHKKGGLEYFATNAWSAYQSLRDVFKPVNYTQAHRQTRARVAAMYATLSRDEGRPDVAEAAKNVLNLLDQQKKGVVNTAALRQASLRLCAALNAASAPGGPVTRPLPEIRIGRLNPQGEHVLASTALSALRDHVNRLPLGSVLLQYGNNDASDPWVYAGARRPDDALADEERASNRDLERDFADTLHFLARQHQVDDKDPAWWPALGLIQHVNTQTKADKPITVTAELRQRLDALCSSLPVR